MKIECKIHLLQNAIRKLERVTGKQVTLPALMGILLSTGNKSIILKATNLNVGIEITIPAAVHQEGTCSIKGNNLLHIFSGLQGNSIKLELEDTTLSLTTKTAHMNIKTIPYDDFPPLPQVSTANTFTIESKKLAQGLHVVVYSAATSEIKPEIASVYLHSTGSELVLVATDSFRLAEKKIKTKGSHEIKGIILPIKNAIELMKILDELDETVSVLWNENQLACTSEGIYFTSRLVSGNFPDYEQIIPKETNTEVTVLKSDLSQNLRTMQLFSDKYNQVIMTVDPKTKEVIFSSTNSDVGAGTVHTPSSVKGEHIEIAINHKYIFESLQSISQDSVTFSFQDVSKPVVVRGVSDSSFTYLVMPMTR